MVETRDGGLVSLRRVAEFVGGEAKQRVQGMTHFQYMITHDAFGLDEDLVDHRVAMVTVHFVDTVLVKLGQRQQQPQGQSLGLLTVAELHRLDTAENHVMEETGHKKNLIRNLCTRASFL